MYTLIIKPKAAKFLKDGDMFGKMDPFVRVRVGNEVQKTETAKGKGKTPTWTTALTFNITQEQYNQADNVGITFEAFDEDSSTSAEFLGRVIYKLSQLKTKLKESTTLKLLNDKNKDVGTMDVELELKTSGVPSNAGNSSSQAGHTLTLKVKSAKLTDMTKMDSFACVKVGNDVQQTEIAQEKGKTPAYIKVFTFKISQDQYNKQDNLEIDFKIYEQDQNATPDLVGGAVYKFSQLKTKMRDALTLKLDKKNKDAGTLDVEMDLKLDPSLPIERPENKNVQPVESLTIKVKSGKFVRDTDLIGKMDPFVVVRVGNEVQQTETAKGKGKTPTWTKTLVYKVPQSLYEKADTVDILFDAHDEDSNGAADYLGSGSYKLSQLKAKLKDATTLKLVDKKKKDAGTLEVELELKLGPLPVAPQVQANQTSTQATQQKGSRLVGTVAVRPGAGSFDIPKPPNQELNITFTHSGVVCMTPITEGVDRKLVFKNPIIHQLYEGEEMSVNCGTMTTSIGQGQIQLTTLVRGGSLHRVAVPLMNAGKKVGDLNVEVEFFSDIFENPVKIFPVIPVKKGEAIPKKVKYLNPDRVKKNIRVRTENKNLVLVKTETLVLLPNQTGEIKFDIFAPKGAEEKCRVDVIVEDAQIIEESLLFKVKSV